MEDHHVPAIDARSFTSDVKSVGFDMKSTFTEVPDRKIPSDLRSVRSEPADKKQLLIKKTSSVKVRKVPGKPKPLPPSKSLPWTPPGHSMKMRCESPKPLSKSSMSPIRRRSPGQASNP